MNDGPSKQAATLPSLADGVWRILDANTNRALEALRTWEEYVRFVLESAELTLRLKEIRHEVSTIGGELSLQHRLSGRDVVRDPGRVSDCRSEYERTDTGDVARAAAARTQQALRCLEEYGKLIDGDLARRFESIRYRLYELEKRTFESPAKTEQLPEAAVCLLADCRQAQEWIIPRAEAFAQAGAVVVQLRDKTAEDRRLLATTRALREALPSDVLLIVNDRPDLARLGSADGVHLGQDDLSVAEAKRIVTRQQLVGVSTHSERQLEQAVLDGADYVGFGPVFPTPTKAFPSFVGPEQTGRIAATSPVPVFAIGGITCNNLEPLLAAGCRRVAVSSAVWTHDDPLIALSELAERLDQSVASSRSEACHHE